GRNGMDERAPHASAGPSHDQPHVGHGISPANSACGYSEAGVRRKGTRLTTARAFSPTRPRPRRLPLRSRVLAYARGWAAKVCVFRSRGTSRGTPLSRRGGRWGRNTGRGGIRVAGRGGSGTAMTRGVQGGEGRLSGSHRSRRSPTEEVPLHASSGATSHGAPAAPSRP